MKAKAIGKVTHFYDKISVAIIKLAAPLKVGDEIEIKGNSTGFKQTVESIQFEHQDLKSAKKGQEVGVKVKEKVRENDQVSLVS